jgi:SAM-dependent methyltransferase
LNWRDRIRNVPMLGAAVSRVRLIIGALRRSLLAFDFRDSSDHWERHYRKGKTSGAGSYGDLAKFKADVINAFIEKHGIGSAIEFGCGDGNQLSLIRYPNYVGLDVSQTALDLCTQKFASDRTKTFFLYDAPNAEGLTAGLSLSLDVIFHLVEDDVFETYMRRLFRAGQRFVIIYSSNTDENLLIRYAHVRNRRFTEWVEANEGHWELLQTIPNKHPWAGDSRTGSRADFYIYGRRDR